MTKFILPLLLIATICFGKEKNKKILTLINGMYELVSWYDGKTLHKDPDISGRWVFMDGNIMKIYHNRTNPKNHESSIGWGNGIVSDGKFKYAYHESLRVKGAKNNLTRSHGPLWDGMRVFKVQLKEGGMVMRSESGKQTWEVTKEGMVYTDTAWGEDKVFVQRKWKRIAP